MSIQEKYCRIEARSIPCGAGWLLLPDTDRAPIQITSLEAAMLASCDTFRTLDEHLHEHERRISVGAEGPLNVPPLDLRHGLETLRALCQRGVLMSLSSALAAMGALPSERESSGIGVLGIVTKNRPRMVERCLSQILSAMGEQSDGHLRMSVYDDSDIETTASSVTRLAARGQSVPVKVTYAGPREKKDYMARISASVPGLPEELVSFALADKYELGHTYGANLNALLLDCVGELAVTMDDDVLARNGYMGGGGQALTLRSCQDPTELWFYNNRSDAIESLSACSDDVATAHNRLLGRTIADVAKEAIAGPGLDVATITPGFLSRVVHDQCRVAATMSGIAGDAGTRRGHSWAGVSGNSRVRLMASPDSYSRFAHTREVVRCATAPTVADGNFFMNTCAGLDVRELLPPFFPVLRNMDGIWGTTLRICCWNRYIGYLPQVVIHDPDPRSEGTIPPSGPGLAEMLISQFLDLRCLTVTRCASDRIQMLGEHLVRIGSQQRTTFQRWLRDTLCAQACLRMGWYQRRLQQGTDQPTQVTEELLYLIGRLQKGILEQEFKIPSDFVGKLDTEEASELTQALILDFGKLLEFWPRIVAAAIRLKEGGYRLACVV